MPITKGNPSKFNPSDNLINTPSLLNNNQYGWRTMDEKEFESLVSGEKTYEGGSPKRGNWIAGVPESAAKFGKKGAVMVEFGGIKIEGGENMSKGSTADKSNVTKVWRYNDKTNKFEEDSDLLAKIKTPVVEAPAVEAPVVETKTETPTQINDDGSFANKYGRDIVKKLIQATGVRQMSMLAKGLRKAGLTVSYAYENPGSTVSQVLSDSMDNIADEYELLSAEEKVEATKILTQLANKLGVEIETKQEAPKAETKPTAEAKTETPVAEPTQAKEPEAEYQKEEPAKQPSKARYQGKSKFGADQEYAVTLDKDGNPTEVKAIINGSEAKSLQIAKIREDKNGKTIITTTDDIISLDKPSVQKEKISFETQKSMNNDMLSKAKESNGDYAIIYTRAGDQIPLKLNRVTGKWMAVNGEGKLVEASEAYQQKAKEAVNWTRKDAKIVDLKTSSNGVPTTTRMVFDFSDNTWKKLNEDEQILYSVPKGMQEKAQSKFVEENPKRAAKREKVEKFFNDRKVDENIIMSTIPGLNPKNINRIIDAAKALVLAGMDLTTAINQAANNVLKQLVREKEITQQEADEALIEVYKGDFLLRPELSGIKNELASENAQEVARKGIDKMGVKEALDAGARAIQDGEVNPESLIETFVQGVGRVLTPIETAAMIRYKAGLDNEISDQYVKLASIEDKNSNEAKQVKTEIERLEKKVENYEIMQVTTGYYQSLSFSLRQFMLTSEYNITKLKAEIAAGYDGKIPEDILAKINEANAKLTQLNKDIARLEREKAKLEDSETIESIKNEKTKSSSGKAITSSNGRISISTDKIKEAISKGADTIEDVIEYVREDVKKQYPDATDREIRDAITNYGKVSSNTKSDLQKKIEEIRSIGKKISALEDIQAEKKRRESSKVTGFFAKQRAKNRLRILSDREQELKRQIKEEMSKMPLTEEEIALKEDKRLEAFKKRTEARIKELKQRIADGDFSTKPRPKSLELDEEAKKLNAEREKILFQFEEEKAKAKYRQRSDAQVAFDALMSVLTLSKSLIASLDFSAPFRQGFVYTMSQDPRKTKKQMQEMFKLMNEENYTNWLADLKASDEYNLIKASKLFVAEPSAELSAREESFMSNLGQYIPVLGKSIKTKSGKEVRVGFDLYGKSERAYSGFLNVLRVQAFMEGATTLKEQGYTMEKNPEVFKAMADFVNNSTGRGTGGRAFENSAAALSAVFFSPRLIKSRLNLFNPVYYYKMPPSVRAIALKRMSKLMATSTMMIALLAIAAAGSGGDDEDDLKIELDPRSSDFAKIRMKDTRIDILGGFQPYFRTFVQAITGEKKDIETGEIKKLNADFGGATKMSVISNLFTNKFSPISRTFYEYLSKYDYQKEADAAKEGKYSAYTALAVPIYLQGRGDLYDEQ